MMPISDRSEPYPSMLAFSGYATYSALSFAEKLSQLVKNFPNAVCWREKKEKKWSKSFVIWILLPVSLVL